MHRHRKGKESDGTIRSGGGGSESSPAAAAAGGGEDTQTEGTPQLQREKGRFILHGKQASVIQFGGDWPSERMRARREKWRGDDSPALGDGAEPNKEKISSTDPREGFCVVSSSAATHLPLRHSVDRCLINKLS